MKGVLFDTVLLVGHLGADVSRLSCKANSPSANIILGLKQLGICNQGRNGICLYIGKPNVNVYRNLFYLKLGSHMNSHEFDFM